MYRRGHQGVALLIYAPVAYVLLATGRPVLAVVGAALMWSLAMLPDIDQRVRFIKHRGPTHTVLFALVVGGLLGAIGWLVGDMVVLVTDRVATILPSITAGFPTDGSTLTQMGERFSAARLAGFGFFIGVVAVLSHLLADLLTIASFSPFWPVSHRAYSLGLTKAANTGANWFLYVVGFLAIGFVFGIESGFLSLVVS
jgi:inner membrane protein